MSAGSLAPPAELSEGAREEWLRVIAAAPPGLLAAVDDGLLRAYTEALALHRVAAAHVAREGVVVAGPRGGRPVQSAWVRIMTAQAGEIRRLAELLGIGPSARARLGVTAGTSDDETAAYLRFIRRQDHDKKDD